MLKKILIIILISTSNIPTIVAQNFGISSQYTIWKGSMLKNEVRDKNNNSIILSLNNYYNLSEKLDVVFSAGYAFGFKIIPLKVNFNYKISDKISANLGMAIYMISDDTYNSRGQLTEDTEKRTEPSRSESGVNFGMSYKLTSTIALTSNYNILKNDEADLNAISFGLSFTPNWGATIKQQNQSMRLD